MGALPETSVLLHEGFSSQLLGLPHSMEAAFKKNHSKYECPKREEIIALILLRPELGSPWMSLLLYSIGQSSHRTSPRERWWWTCSISWCEELHAHRGGEESLGDIFGDGQPQKFPGSCHRTPMLPSRHSELSLSYMTILSYKGGWKTDFLNWHLCTWIKTEGLASMKEWVEVSHQRFLGGSIS